MERMMEFQAPRLTAPALPFVSVSGWSVVALILGAFAVWLLIGLVVALVMGRVVSLAEQRRPRPAEPSPGMPQHRDGAGPSSTQTGPGVHDDAPDPPSSSDRRDGTTGVTDPTVEPPRPASDRTARPGDQHDMARGSQLVSSRHPGHGQVADRGPAPAVPYRMS